MSGPDRLFLSPPHMSGEEEELVADAFRSNWIAPLGPHVDAFEEEFARHVGAAEAVALSSGTAALHLALQLVGVGPGDDVLVSDFTFVASVNPIRYVGAVPTLIDAEPTSWNLDPDLVAEELADRARAGRLPAAVVVVHLYGQTADMERLLDVCRSFEVPLAEDAAEALGATWQGRSPGTLGKAGIFSFNGNKIITTSGGGMLVTGDRKLAQHARKLATQARDPAPYYQHSELGYNYRLSNLLAAVGRGQLRSLEDRVARRREIFERYRSALSALPGLSVQSEAPWGVHSRWLTTLLVDEERFGAGRDGICAAMEVENIEARPVWKPMHRQPLYRDCRVVGGTVSDALFRDGLCLPSGSAMTEGDVGRVVDVLSALCSAT